MLREHKHIHIHTTLLYAFDWSIWSVGSEFANIMLHKFGSVVLMRPKNQFQHLDIFHL